MSQKNKTKPEIYDFIYEDKYLCITCPKCKKIPFLSFDKKNPELINIKCEQCGYSSTNHLNNYLKGLSSKNIFPIKKCEKHTNFLNKYCHKCNIQFCSECEEKAIHSNHYVITLTKKFKSEKIKEVKEIIEVYKNDFKTYIRTFMQKYFNNFPKNKHIYITNDLLKNYIQDMKNFFHFCECILLNYDIEYPDYYQQINLKDLIYVLVDNIKLKDLSEKKLERLFRYYNNNFITNNTNIGKYCRLYSSDNLKSVIKAYSFVEDDLILLLFDDCLKLYNYKNKTCISKIDTNFSDCNDAEFIPINKEKIGLYFRYGGKKLLIYSIHSIQLLFEKTFDSGVSKIKLLNDNLFGVLRRRDRFLDIYSLIDNSKSLELQLIKSIEVKDWREFSFFYLSKENYLIIFEPYYNSCKVYDKDFNIIKEMDTKKFKQFYNIYITKYGHIILEGRNISILNPKDWSVTVLHDDNIPESTLSYLSGYDTYIEYYDIFLTNSNRFICKRYKKNTYKCHYEDVDVSSDVEYNEYIFNFNPESCKMNMMTEIPSNQRMRYDYINEDEEMIRISGSRIEVYYLK